MEKNTRVGINHGRIYGTRITRETTIVMRAAITSINHLLVIYFFMYILSPRTNITLENYYGDEEESC